LLVQLEAALPSWLLNHVEVRYSFQSTEDEKTLRQWIQHVTRAADEPNANEASPYTEQLTKVKQNLFELNERFVLIMVARPYTVSYNLKFCLSLYLIMFTKITVCCVLVIYLELYHITFVA
jgi:hypothetical protein